MTARGGLIVALLGIIGCGAVVLAAESDADVAAEAEMMPRYELMVVGVYRPLDLEGRTIVEPREIFLQSVALPEGPLSNLIGRTLEVVRMAPVPAIVPMAAPHAAMADADAGPESDAEPRTRRRRRRRTRPPTPPVDAGVLPDAAPDVARRVPEPVPTTMVETPVGRIEVTAVRGEIVVARVIEDGVGAGPARSKVEMQVMGTAGTRVDVPAIMAGDYARWAQPPPIPPPPPPLSDAERARLEAEQTRIEKDDARRRARPKPYERPVMKWKL